MVLINLARLKFIIIRFTPFESEWMMILEEEEMAFFLYSSIL